VRVVVVGGTDTGVGKTVVTATLAAAARHHGARVAVVKPAQTGLAQGEHGDVDEVRRLTGIEDVHELARYGDPLAPATAARRVGERGPPLEGIVAYVRDLGDRDVVIIEGAGGLLVRFNAGGTTVIDIAAALAAPALLVTRAGLGALNHAALSSEALTSRRVRCAGLVIGMWPAQPDEAARANLSDLPDYCGVPLRGRVPEGAGAMHARDFCQQAPHWIKTGLLDETCPART